MSYLCSTRALAGTALCLAVWACNTSNFAGAKNISATAASTPAQALDSAKLAEPATALDSSSIDSCSAVLSTSGYRDAQRNMVFRQLPATEDYCGALDACSALDPQAQFLTIGEDVTDAMRTCLHLITYWAFLAGESKALWQQKYCGKQLSLYNIAAATTKEKARYVMCTYPYRAP